jgi:hypothetical protein
VREDTTRSVRVVDHERQRPCPVGDVCPAKRRRDVLALAGVAAGDGLGVLERAGLESELGHQQVK